MFQFPSRSTRRLFLHVWVGLTVLSPLFCPAEILYRHLGYNLHWYDCPFDRIAVSGTIRNTNPLPAGRYVVMDASDQVISVFTLQGPAEPGTVLAQSGSGLGGEACTLHICPYQTRDLHGSYFMQAASGLVGPIVGTVQGGFVVSDVAMVGGVASTLSVHTDYTLTYGAHPLDMNNSGPDGDRCSPGMASYNINKALVALILTDTPLGYQPARGPAVNFTVSYNSQSWQPGQYGFVNLGPHWTFNWLSYVVYNPSDVPSTQIYLPGGGVEKCSGFDTGTHSFAPDPYTHAILVKTPDVSPTFERHLPDGSMQVYSVSEGTRIFMSKLIDPAGNFVTLAYTNGTLIDRPRLSTITDALGKVTTLHYDNQNNDLLITSVTNEFGKTATFTYADPNDLGPNRGKLIQIRDPAGIISEFGWEDDGFINTLTTPYGATQFAHGQSVADGNTNVIWLEVTDPLLGKERVEYRDFTSAIPAADPANTVPAGFTDANANLNVRNTFYWDKKYSPPGGVYDYTKARITHWLLTADGGVVSRVPASEKAPLENRVWYAYADQPDYQKIGPSNRPIKRARVLDDGTTQLHQYEYNGQGNVTKTTDPVGRVFTNVYATNGIDVIEKRQTRDSNNELLRSTTYNSLHEPLVDTDAAGQPTTYVYRSDGHGQLQSVQNAKGETTTYAYGLATDVPADYLASITSPTFNGSSAITGFTYDSANRVHTVTTSPDNYTETTDYDDLDRPIKTTYPDSTYQEFKYTDNITGAKTLDLTGTRDRRGRWTYRHYNANRQLDSVTDPKDRTTLYGWCSCGSLETITDPNQNVTTFNRDLQGRVYQKVFADNTAINYLYEGQTGPNTVGATSRLKSMTDAKNQRKNYSYTIDDNVSQVTYTDTSGNQLTPPTPTVSYSYDPNYNRVASMTDGTGLTSCAYYPVAVPPPLGAGQLQYVDGPLANDTISYAYDELGRQLSTDVNGTSAARTFDVLGRVSSETNPLGQFVNTYDGVTDRLQNVVAPNSQTIGYSYFNNTGDRRLQTVQSTGPSSSPVSKFDYLYDAEGQITKWTRRSGLANSVQWDNGTDSMGDLADQLKSVTQRDVATQATQATYSYDYDDGGNRTTDASGTYSINNVNQITNSGYTYDLTGNLTGNGVRTFEWDAANRLTAINHPAGSPGLTSDRTEFTYDGLGRRVQLIEKDNTGTVRRTSKFVWNGQIMAEERDSANTVVKRFYPQGISLPGASSPGGKLFYSKDHLGSVRSLTNENGTLIAAYDYDPYGRVSLAPVPTNDTSVGPVVTGAVSRQTHGSAGTFDVALPLVGAPGIEPRSTSGGFTVVVSFDRAITSASATVASGVGSAGAPSISGSTATVQLSGVTDRQVVTLELDNVTAQSGGTIAPKVLIAMAVLVADVNQDGAVTTEDGNLVRGSSGVAVTTSTFKYDVNVNGSINVSDAGLTNSKISQGAALFTDSTYTGHYYHVRSGLYLTLYRAYNPTIGRWISRDPIEESGRLNLYEYVANNPTTRIDPFGLLDFHFYGNWGGPGYTGGQWTTAGHQYEDMTPPERAALNPPIDRQDACYMYHDICYANCRRQLPCDPSARSACYRNCDRELSRCLKRLPPNDPSNNWRARAAGWYFASSNPGA